MKKNITLRLRSMFKDTFTLCLFIVGFVLFTGAMVFFVMGFMQEKMDVDVLPAFIMTSNILRVMPFLNIFLIFFSFESCYSLKKNSESVYATKKGMKSLYVNQLLILTGFVFALFVEGCIFDFVSICIAKQLSIGMIVTSFTALFVYLFVSGVSSCFLGFIFSFIKMRIVPYILMVIFAITETDMVDKLSAGIYKGLGFDATKILKFFNFVPSNIYFFPNMYTGQMISREHICHFLFFIIVGILVLLLSDTKEKFTSKKIIKTAILSVLGVVMLVGYALPYSIPNLDYGGGGVSSDFYSYKKMDQQEKEANFKVKKYNLKFSFTSKLNGVADITVDNSALENYDFTLYHGYKVKKITDKTGKKVDFTRDGDCLTFSNPAKCDEFTVYYSGKNDKYYSNYTNVCLPGGFAYFPVPGFEKVYCNDGEWMAQTGFNDLSLDYDVDFDVSIEHYGKVYSNLSVEPDKHFSGRARSLTLINGFVSTQTVENCTVLYPRYDSEFTPENIRDDVVNLKKINSDVNEVIILPYMESPYGDAVKLDNYMVARYLNACYNNTDTLGLQKYLIIPYKVELSSAIEIYMMKDTDEYSQSMFSGTLNGDNGQYPKELLTEVVSILENDEDNKKTEQIKRYLTDKNDKTPIMDFLKKLKNE